jgi:hypothetical protein
MRGIMEVRALVTSRMQPLDIDGKRVNTSLIHFLQRKEPGLAWGCRSAAQSLSRTEGNCGPLMFPEVVQLFSSVCRGLTLADSQPEKI